MMNKPKKTGTGKVATSPPADAVPSANRNGERTRVQILDAAETLFSEHGLDGVSMRDIAVSAEVTLALVNYHFGSKDKLYRMVFERRIVPVSASRRAALALVLDRKSPAPVIREVLDALARPWVEMRLHPGGLAYSRLIAREVGDPAEGKRGIVSDLLDPIALEFMDAMQQVMPKMAAGRVAWAYHFFIGALLLILSNPDRVTRLSGKVCDVGDEQAVIDEIVNLFARAFEGPDAPARKKPSTSTTKSRKPETGKKKA
ncbi:MAG: TetR/AcrR family transcriptional regulator [Pseudomonadota bacterium]